MNAVSWHRRMAIHSPSPTRGDATLLLLVVLLIASPVWGQDGSSALLLSGARILDPVSGTIGASQQVRVENGRIAEIGAALTVPPGGREIKLDGLVLLPGLIDLHSHLLLHPYNEASWNDQVLKESLELRTIRAVAAGKATLEAGFTTLRDLGTEGAGFADVALRDAFASGMVPGPRVFAVTRAIVATGCYGPSGFDPRWDVPQGAQEASGVPEVRKAVREQIAAGADWIKVYADYRRRPGAPPTATFSQEELNALVDEAKSAGLPVAAHAYTDEGIRRAVLAGASTIEHGFQASDEVLTLMRDRGVVLCPTLAAADATSRYAGWKPGTPDPPAVRASKEMFARAMKVGVTIANGSDVGVFAHGENVRELKLMAAYGMPLADVLRAATTTAAKVLGKENELGRIAPGFVADLIAVRGDPLTDLSALDRPVLVIKDGRVACYRSDK